MSENADNSAPEYSVTGTQPESENGQTLLMLLGIAAALIVTGTGLNWLFS